MFAKRNRKNPFHDRYPGQIMYKNPYDFRMFQHGWRQSFYPVPNQQANWQAYPAQNPYYPQQYQPLGQSYQQGYSQQPQPYSNQNQYYPPKDAQFLFQNPLQPQEEMYSIPNQYPQAMNGYPKANPYPKQNYLPKTPGGMNSLINSFKSQDGSVDFTKMVNTAGQMMNAVNQVTSLVKGLGGIFKV